MASAQTEEESASDKTLNDLFLEGWRAYVQVQTNKTLETNSLEFQKLVQHGIDCFEKATRLVSQIGLFSPNEMIDEISTESLQYLLLPLFLGKLVLQLVRRDRSNVVQVAEVYYKDFLQRCREYELYEPTNQVAVPTQASEEADPMKSLYKAGVARNSKIAQYNIKKELAEQIEQMQAAVFNKTADEEVKRDFFLKYIKKGIFDAIEEIELIELEKRVLEMQKHRDNISASQAIMDDAGSTSAGLTRVRQHKHTHTHSEYKPEPLKPFIITRNDVQKAVFGRGYPSMPVMTVNDFYQQRVDEGVFPDEEKQKQIEQAKAIAAARDPEEVEEEEKRVQEELIENDDPEERARLLRMDEYNDEVRRGDGNRHNRS